MSNYIVAFDMSDDAISTACNFLYKNLSTPKSVVDINQVTSWPKPPGGCTLYIVNHANGTQFGDYENPSELFMDHENLLNVYKAASKVVLVACSAANEADLILKKGFQAKTFAQNLKALDKSKTILAAVGPVFPTESGLFVKVPNNAIGFGSKDGWVQY